ncbi:MAG: type II toxin-antitoxin system VapC family toxin [Candidatus Binatia bacterium]
MRFLCDTNVLSELSRGTPNRRVLRWAEGVTEEIALSVVTVEEVYLGLMCRPQPRVQGWFEAFLERRCRVMAIDDQVARRAGQLRGRLSAEGKTRTQADMLIAATVWVHRLTLVTRNERDFAGCEVAVLNPFA